jgi:hypothetical protein
MAKALEVGKNCGIVITSARVWREESAFPVSYQKQIPRFARDDNSKGS